MKCNNCGNNEANFHFQSNINGKITETHLCSECAGKLGYDMGDAFSDTQNMFGDMISDFFGFGRSMMSPFGGFGFGMPAFAVPAMVLPSYNVKVYDGTQRAEKPEEKESMGDPEMQKRRELNMLKEQMKSAAESEDFEKAAEIRDKIKKIEGSGN